MHFSPQPKPLTSYKLAVVPKDPHPLDIAQRAWVWQDTNYGTEPLTDADRQGLARSYAISEDAIRETIDVVRGVRALGGDVPPLQNDLAREARRRLSRGIEGVADKVATGASFDDLVVPDSVREKLRDVMNYVVHLEEVARTTKILASGRGRGTTVLLHGPSGTGKTHAAAVIAHEAGRDLYRIDTSRVVDKYIGETEKQLDRVFRLAEASGSIILFDEADSLFAKRKSSGGGSGDRFANMTVNFLLQRMEDYSGMCVMTTNLLDAIDPAFRRRIPFQIGFPKPEAEERVGLWTYFLSLVGGPEIDEDTLWDLAEQCDMTGAHIRNAVLKATVRAVADKAPMTRAHLLLAAEQEYASLGGLVRRMTD